jgi:hypothetical protein
MARLPSFFLRLKKIPLNVNNPFPISIHSSRDIQFPHLHYWDMHHF